jgi:outer membrane protein OmpA-like peptidoglycan-associated protein
MYKYSSAISDNGTGCFQAVGFGMENPVAQATDRKCGVFI